MPYFLFKMFPNRNVEVIENHEKYRDARDSARAKRKQLTVSDNYQVKIIFAANEQAGVKLLTTEREAEPWGDDWVVYDAIASGYSILLCSKEEGFALTPFWNGWGSRTVQLLPADECKE